ncbi:MAG: hypothetical protein KKA73_05640 [Chloroflexi bacterium]|nr:hypothetical protein [Chloroflexota bacterium]MBU1747150.1 hypothetical protein [Chloroflexota bacterium]
MTREPLPLFLHIPKTAGLTVRQSVLPRQVQRDEIFATIFTSVPRTDGSRAVGVRAADLDAIGLFAGMRRPDDIWYPESLPAAAARFHHAQRPAEERARVRLIWGVHVEYGLHEHLDEPVSYFTLLREPVDRALSHYYFAREPRCAPEDPGLPEHLAAHVEANLQTRLLAGPLLLAGQQGQGEALSPEELLARAQANLRACAVVGLTERFDETMLLLKKAYGWRMPFYERQNVSQKRPLREAIPAPVRRQIEADNQFDVALYALAQELFAAQVQQYGPAFARDLRVFRALNWLWQRGQRAQRWVRETATALDERLLAPPYQALARWGGLRRLLPARLAPRVVASVEDNLLFFDLWIGRRMVGSYDHQQQRWEIQRPFHLFVDEGALPGAVAGSEAPAPLS